jgi:hypothetical protein
LNVIVRTSKGTGVPAWIPNPRSAVSRSWSVRARDDHLDVHAHDDVNASVKDNDNDNDNDDDNLKVAMRSVWLEDQEISTPA